jgi:HK97 family phage major capsid protein
MRGAPEGRDMNAEEVAEETRLRARFVELQNRAEAIKRAIEEIDNAAGAVSQGRVVPAPIGGQRHLSHSATRGPLYAQMFGNAANSSREFRNLGEFARAVAVRDPRLFSNASGASEGVGADGGFYVPAQFYSGIMDDSLQPEAVRPFATTSASVSIPMCDLSNRSTGIATLEGRPTGEGVTGTSQKARVREVQMTAKKISVLVPTTDELMMDAPELFSGLLETAMTDALAQTLDTWFLSSTGTGAGVPLSILNAPCTVSVAKDTSQVAATITPTNIAGMVSRLAPGSWRNARWIVSPSALAQLFTLGTVTKNVAGTENVSGHAPEFFSVLPNGEFSLLGRPLIVSDRCAALGTVGDILLCDMKSYLVGIRQNAELLIDRSIGFKESETWFRLNCRIDGQPALAAAITPRVGSATLSPFVSPATRS